ncbi:hypothetical protein BG005_001708 [Podila minutissima]|nr:hypothetical protein BG005_001708 [Podila minutissima]
MTCPDPLINSDPSTLYHLYNEKHGFLPAPVQNEQPIKASKKKKNLLKKFLLVVLVLLGYLFYKFLLPLYNGWPFYHHDHDHGHDIIIVGDTCSHDTGALFLREELCRANAVPWSGPSTFSTASDRFLLTIGKGNMAVRVRVQTSPNVQEPTLKIAGYVSPVGDSDDGMNPVAVTPTTGEPKSDIEHQGVTVHITEDGYAYDVQIQYHDRVLHNPSGDKYCACARFELQVLLPESYTRYSQLIINGATAEIEVFDVDDIRFGELWFEVGVGNVVSSGELLVDALAVDVKTGNIDIESVEAATKGAPLAVLAEAVTGDVTLHARTKPAGAAHDLRATSKTGSVKVTVTPASSSFSSLPWLSKPADLNIHTEAVEGSARALVELESRAQTLRLDATSSTDSASALISDDFSGRFRVESQSEEANVYEADASESVITYEKQTSSMKEGVKSFSGETPQEGHVSLKSSLGLVVLEFTN